MAIVHPHNLRNPDAAIQRPYGVRITLKPGDPFRKLLGADWNKTHWYGTARWSATRRSPRWRAGTSIPGPATSRR